jgi:hypothetical protein
MKCQAIQKSRAVPGNCAFFLGGKPQFVTVGIIKTIASFLGWRLFYVE